MPLSVTRVPDYDDIAQTLATEYTVELAETADIAIVTHSQGGLILQRFLTWMLHQGRGRELARIRTIVMLACPNGGSEYLRSVRHVLGFGRHAQAGSLEVLAKQVADTQRAVIQRIVGATGVDDHQCRIPFHVYAGNSDKVVTAASAQGAFPGASTLSGNHFSILDPASPGNHTAETVRDGLINAMAALPAHLRGSLTWDQGAQMAGHKTFTLATDMQVYFCDPASPWQRGSNENTNGLLRQYFPKGTDLSAYGPEDLEHVAQELNGRPRKTLDWDTPAERLRDLLLTT